VNISRWHPSDDHDGPEFRFLLALLPEHEREECLRFRFMDDKKRALLSRLMQRAACARVADVPHADVLLRRTKGKKPFFAWTEMPSFDADSAADLAAAPNFNFNVSHEGEFVVLASEPVCIVGVDVAAPGQLRNRNRKGGAPSVEETLQSFRETLSVSERNAIRAFRTDAEKEDAFRRHWSCKEALVKAMGVGLGMELGRASFSFKKQHEHAYDAVVEVDGEPKTKWRFRTERVFGSSSDAFSPCFGDDGSGEREYTNETRTGSPPRAGPRRTSRTRSARS
jgi:4'-phosphopantetheinyl transferase